MPTVGKGTYTKVTLSGPFFQQDVDKVFGRNVELMLADAAEEMESEVQRLIEGRAGNMPYYTGRSKRSVRGRVASLSGKQWHRHAVISADTSGMSRKDAIRTKAAAASIERRWHPFRRVASATRRIRRDLTKGLN